MSTPAGGREPKTQLRLREALIGHRPGEALFPRLDFELFAGEWLVVAGPNGAGKSSFVQTLLGTLPLLEGRRELGMPGLRFGYVPQRLELDPIWPLSALDVVCMGGAPWLKPFGRSATLRGRALELLEEVGLAGAAELPFRSLSGGQKQRALIARALVAGAEVLVLDEPANHLDLPGERALVEMLSALHQRRAPTIVWISHRLEALLGRADRIVFLRRGAFRVGPPRALLEEGVLEGFWEGGKA